MSQHQSFEKEFATLRELGSETFVLRGSSIIVELQEKEEVKTQGGIIIATPDSHTRKSVEAHRIIVGKVLMTGPGYWVEASDGMGHEMSGYEPLEVKVGAIVLMPQDTYSWVSYFPGITRPTNDKLALVKMDSIVGYYPTEEAYKTAREKLNA